VITPGRAEDQTQFFRRQVARWKAELRLWLSDARVWREEFEEAPPDLPKPNDDLLRGFREELAGYAEELRAYEQLMQSHERILSQRVQGCDVMPFDWVIQAHKALQKRRGTLHVLHATHKIRFESLMYAVTIPKSRKANGTIRQTCLIG
jgi:hypothetical protein